METPTTLGLCDISPSCPAVVAAQLDTLPVSVCAIVSAYVMATPASAQADVDDTLVLLQRADAAVQNSGDVEDDNLQTLIEQTQDLKKMYKRLRSVADLIGDHVVSSLISGHSDVVANDGLMEQDIMVFFRQLTRVVRCECYDADMLARLCRCVVVVKQTDKMFQLAAQRHDDRQSDAAQSNAAWLAAKAVAAHFEAA